ncbi:MAG: creatininase family protein, partial [Gemmataceae bacterium]|nr:creatininase family protein [Gemmataceae bacterium]
MPPRPFVLHEANYRQLLDHRPAVAVLPWGATEAHNYHLPHGTDVIEASAVAERAAELAHRAGARVVVLPAVPFGNNAQQLDQVATVSIRTATALAILGDVARSLAAQGIDRLVLVNAHGGNDFKPLVRDVRAETGVLVVLADFYRMAPAELRSIFDDPGDHAGEMETSLLLHLCPEWVAMAQAGEGRAVPFAIEALRGVPGVWTPRPWSAVHPDTGCGDPSKATAEKGRRYLEAVGRELAGVLVGLAGATKGQ